VKNKSNSGKRYSDCGHYPQIAKAVGAAVGTVWNAINNVAQPLEKMAT